MGPLRPSWPLACFAGSAFAFILPAHIVIALLAIVGVGAVWTIRIGAVAARDATAAHRRADLAANRRRDGRRGRCDRGLGLTHGSRAWRLGGPLAGISPFNDSWRDTVLIVTLGAGVLLAIPVAWLLARRTAPFLADLCLGTLALLVAGAIAWGWKLASFNMFYFFFAGIAVIATPVAAVASWWLVERWRAAQHPRWVLAAVAVCLLQLELGLVIGLTRLQGQAAGLRADPRRRPRCHRGAAGGREAGLRVPGVRGDLVRQLEAPRHRRPHGSPDRADVLRGRRERAAPRGTGLAADGGRRVRLCSTSERSIPTLRPALRRPRSRRSCGLTASTTSTPMPHIRTPWYPTRSRSHRAPASNSCGCHEPDQSSPKRKRRELIASNAGTSSPWWVWSSRRSAIPLGLAAYAGAIGLPSNDDWVYMRAANGVYETGQVGAFGHTTAFVGQLGLVQPFLWLSGGQPWAFTAFGLVMAAARHRLYVPAGPTLRRDRLGCDGGPAGACLPRLRSLVGELHDGCAHLRAHHALPATGDEVG